MLILTILFIINEFYYIINKTHLDKPFKSKDLSLNKPLDLIHYILRVSYWIWLIIGLANGVFLYKILMSLDVIKTVLFYINKRYFKTFSLFTPLIKLSI